MKGDGARGERASCKPLKNEDCCGAVYKRLKEDASALKKVSFTSFTTFI